MEVAQRQKEFTESTKISATKNKALLRDNNRLKDEVAMLRQELGLKPRPDQIEDYDDNDDFGAP